MLCVRNPIIRYSSENKYLKYLLDDRKEAENEFLSLSFRGYLGPNIHKDTQMHAFSNFEVKLEFSFVAGT